MLILSKEIYPAHKSVRNPPQNLKEEDVKLFEHEFVSSIFSTSFLIIKNADILADTVFDMSNFNFYPSFTHINGDFSKIDKIRKLKLYLRKGCHIKKGVWITQNWTSMYFHWLTDALTRLIALEDHVDKFPVLLPFSYSEYPYIIDSLKILGYEYYFYSPNKRVSIHELILPSHTASPGNYNSFYLNKLRRRFVKKETTPFRKIFISRNLAKQRFIINEEEVMNILREHDFEIHIFENYSLSKQIELMNETSVLFGLHGAGLTNMLFMPENGIVVEVRNSQDSHNNCYFSMASELKHSYFYLLGVGDSENTSSVNINISVDLLKNFLNLIK